MTNLEYYNVLGVSQNASGSEIKKAYRNLIGKFHPDRNKGDSNAEQIAKSINLAYETLIDPAKRLLYDQSTVDATQLNEMNRNVDPFVIPARIIGQFLFYHIVVSPEELNLGKNVQISVPARSSCSVCLGHGIIRNMHPISCIACLGTGVDPLLCIENCRICQGFGKLYYSKCNECNGNGWNILFSSQIFMIPQGSRIGVPISLGSHDIFGFPGSPPGGMVLFLHAR